jgi:hypothetical protein
MPTINVGKPDISPGNFVNFLKPKVMKNLIIVLMLVFTPMLLFGQNLKALDDKYGFRGMRFETPIDSFKNLVQVEKDFYKSTTEDLHLGDYELSKIVYGFYKGQLYAVTIRTKGYANSRGVLNILQQGYGKGDQENPYIEEYWWMGEKVWMKYEQNSVTNDATILMVCVKLSELRRADEKKANEEAAKKL